MDDDITKITLEEVAKQNPKRLKRLLIYEKKINQSFQEGIKRERTAMNTINVVAAVIKHENTIFATQRGYGDLKGGWEFPGGKIEHGETPEAALVREIQEELNIEIQVHDMIGMIEYDYPTFHLKMCCYWCSIVGGKLELLEHDAARWLRREELYSVPWLPADQLLLEKIEGKM